VRIDRVRLENFKCYEDADVRLNRGVTVIHGLNGSGKSSLLEACFFALYGANALESTLDEIVTIGAEETVVELWFTHAGESYHVRRRIRVSNGDARTAACVLEGPDGTTEGATDVRARIASMLRMDSEAFVNCAYVRQGEVNKLINASPATRQDTLDDLLQLGTLEAYRERASDARVGIGRVRDDKRGALSEVDEQLAEREAKGLHERRNTLETSLSEVATKRERYEDNRDEAERTRTEAEAVIEQFEQKREELQTVETEIETLGDRIRETERERDELADRASECQERLEEARERRGELLGAVELEEDGQEAVSDRIESLRGRIDDVTEEIRELSVEKTEHDNEAERLAEEAAELESTAEKKREEAAELEAELAETRERLDDRRERIEEMGREIEQKREAFADAPVALGEAADHRESVAEELAGARERRTGIAADLENERERLEEARALLAEGSCPECGQPVEESPHVHAIDEYEKRVTELESELESVGERVEEREAALEQARALVELESAVERLETERKNVAQLLEQREAATEEKRTRVERLQEEADDHEREAETKREAADDARDGAAERQAAIAECNRRQAEYRTQLETLETLAELLDRIESLERERERIRSQRAEKEELNDERRERLAEKRERRAELRETFDEERIEQARTQKQNAEEYLERVAEALSELETKRADLQGQLGAVENEIAAMAELRERHEALAGAVERLESLYSEAEQLEQLYGTLRAELRQRNIESLERMLNETFALVYENDTYSQIEIDGEYRLTVYQKDGETLDPEQLSGGERALFNLSLRCAIYQLLAEGIEGAAPMPPLILDEPTVFLDAGHVSRLVELVGAMYDLGVEQILVVSHDDELVAAADELVTVRKDPTTNRSTVERADALERLAADD